MLGNVDIGQICPKSKQNCQAVVLRELQSRSRGVALTYGPKKPKTISSPG